MLYYIKQHIPKLVIADDYEENSGDPIIQICVEVKRLIFSQIFGFLTAINIIPTNKMCLNVFLIDKFKPDNSVQPWPLALVMGHLSRCPTQWHMHFLACLRSHFWLFLQYFSFSLTPPDESLVGAS